LAFNFFLSKNSQKLNISTPGTPNPPIFSLFSPFISAQNPASRPYQFQLRLVLRPSANVNFSFHLKSKFSNLRSENAGQRSVESLKIHINERCFQNKVLPFVLNFREQMPNFVELELVACNVHFKVS
jgi:hypothetical protein